MVIACLFLWARAKNKIAPCRFLLPKIVRCSANEIFHFSSLILLPHTSCKLYNNSNRIYLLRLDIATPRLPYTTSANGHFKVNAINYHQGHPAVYSWGWNMDPLLKVRKDKDIGIIHLEHLVKQFAQPSQLFMKRLWLSALLKDTSVTTRIRTHTLLPKTPNLGPVNIHRSATTCHHSLCVITMKEQSKQNLKCLASNW